MMASLWWRSSVCSLLFYWVVPLLSSHHTCPVNQYPFSCSACLSFSLLNSTYPTASQQCEEQDGGLLTIRDEVEWKMLMLYLDSLNLSHAGVWLGYTVGEGGEVSGEAWDNAPNVMSESIRRSLSTGGGSGECVMVREGELVNAVCSMELNYVCLFTYSAPQLVNSDPPLGRVYQASSQTLSLKASIAGFGINKVEWTHNQMSLTTSNNVDIVTNHDNTRTELHVTGYTTEMYGGSYELLVTSPPGRTVVATWSVEEAALGSFTRVPQDLTIPEGSIAFFECSMEDAMPTPNYTWYKGEDPVVPDGRSVYVSNVTHTLLMREVGDEQEGSYHCRVENSAGSMDSPPATLTVRPQQEFAGSEVQFLLQPRNYTVLEGQPYSFECVGLHTHREYTYLINYTNALLYPAYPGFPVMIIESVSLSDHAGSQSVCICGPVGMFNSWIASQPAVVTVHTQPHVDPLMTSVGNGSGPHSIPLNDNLGVECQFSGVPNPVHKWYQNGRVVQSEAVDYGSGMAEGSYVVVQESFATKSGVYQCHVSNQHGVDISTTVLCAHSLPGSTPFTVLSDTISSLYVTWSTPEPPSCHPLLLRYEIITTHTLTNHTISSGALLPHQSPWVVEGLNVSSQYEVNVISWSPLGTGAEEPTQTAFTFGPAPQQSPLEFLNITVSRTHQNHGLVIQWNLTVLPPQGTIFAYYQIQYQVAGREAVGGGEVKAVQVEANERWVFVNDLEDAQAYEIRLRVGVLVQRSPPDHDHTPWTWWMPVEGVTTPPFTSSPPITTPSKGPAERPASNQDSILLVAVLVPVLSVVVVAVLLVPVTVGGWRLWAKRRAATYNPRKHERRRRKGRQIPMGRDVFNLPVVDSAVIEEGNCEAGEEVGDSVAVSSLPTTTSSRPSSRSDDLTVDSPDHIQSSNAE